MFKNSFFSRIYFSYVAVIFLTSIAIGLLISDEIEKSALEEIDNNLESSAVLLREISRDQMASGNLESLQEKLVSFSNQIDSRVTIIDADGKVLADSLGDPSLMDNHIARPEIQGAKTHGSAYATRYSHTLSKNMRYFAIAKTGEGKVDSFYRVSLPLETIDQKLDSLQVSIFFGALIASLFGLLASFFFARRISKPIIDIKESAGAIAAGNFEEKIPFSDKNELGELVESFNYLVEESSKRFKQLVDDKNKLATIFSGMVESVIAIDNDFKIIHINEAAARLLDVSISTSVGVSAWEIIHIEEVNKIVLEVLQDKNIVQKQVQIAAEPIDLVLDVYCASTSNNDGSMGAILVLHDLSELFRLEKVRSDFVANASHELKTPITVISGVIDTILDDLAMPKDVMRNFLVKTQTQTERLGNIVSDLMDISRLENTNQQLDEKIDLTALLKKIVNNFQVIAKEKGIDIFYSKPSKNSYIQGDSYSLSQLFDNLLDNAIKYTPEQGQIDIELVIKDAHVEIFVRDNGVGIGKEDLPRVFERFYRVDKGRSRDLGGTGLGLAIVKHITEQHDGEIQVNSEFGRGTEFTLKFKQV